VAEIYRGVAPFIAVQIVALAIITYVPELSLWATRRF
jgi:TRAP-type C4-dicarboxylate transport system permease large subunit